MLLDTREGGIALPGVPPPPTYTLAISTSTGGTTDPLPGDYVFGEGTSVAVTAIPQNDYYFDHWELDGAVKTDNPIDVLMDKDHTLLATFSTTPPPPPPPKPPVSWHTLALMGGLFAAGLIGMMKIK